MPRISIIIRTLNPHRPTLARTLESLRRQTLGHGQTELLVVDNGSDPALDAAAIGLNWHPDARVVPEPVRGKMMAQRTGIRAAAPDCDLLLFVDDDNVFREDYLAVGARLARDFAQLGAWGSGTIRLQFTESPPPESRALLPILTAWEYPYAAWSSVKDLRAYSVPAGMGMFVRRQVAEHWASIFDGSPIRRALWVDAASPVLFAEDTDLALAAPDLGLGTGIFPELAIDHLVRREKVGVERMLGLIANLQRSEAIMRAVRGLDATTRFQRWRKELNDHAKLFFLRGIARRAQRALLRGRARGRREVGAYLAAHPEERPAVVRQPWNG